VISLEKIRAVVLAEFSFAEVRPATAFKVDGGRVEKHQIHFAEQIAIFLKQHLFDPVLGSPRGT